MRQQLAREGLDDASRMHFHFALGKALEDAADYAESFEHYAKGNALGHAPRIPTTRTGTARASRGCGEYSPASSSANATGSGFDAPDPIFIVSMPRAGSTLLEQILSSHSAVEGTSELPEIITLARDLRAEADEDETIAYADVLAAKSAAELRATG